MRSRRFTTRRQTAGTAQTTAEAVATRVVEAWDVAGWGEWAEWGEWEAEWAADGGEWEILVAASAARNGIASLRIPSSCGSTNTPTRLWLSTTPTTPKLSTLTAKSIRIKMRTAIRS